MLNGQGIVDTAGAFFDGADDVPFNITNMFIIGSSIESDAHRGEVSMEGFKFTIHDDVLNFHTMSLVDGVGASSGCEQGFQFLVIEDFNSAKFDAAGYRNQEGDLIDIHDVTGELYMMALFHDRGGDIGSSEVDSIGRLPNGLAFKGASVGTKDVFCIQDVHPQDRAIGQQIAINNPQEDLGAWTANDALKFVGKTSLGVLLSHETGFVVLDSGD